MSDVPDMLALCLERAVAAGPDAIPLERFTDDDMLDASLAPLRRRYPGGDRRAIASIWVKLLCRAVIGPLGAHLVQATTAGGPAPRPVGLVLRDAEPVCLALQPAGLPHAEALADAVLCDHLAPVFEALRRRTGLSVRVAWSNAGNLLDWVLAGLADDPRWSAAAEHWRAELIGAARTERFAGRNPLHAPVRTVAIAVDGRSIMHRQRRVCCLRDRMTGLPLCTTCPRLSADALAALARAHAAEG